MTTGSRKIVLAILILAFVSSAALIPAFSDDSNAETDKVYVFDASGEGITVPAGGSTSLDVTVRNTNDYVLNSLENLIHITFTVSITNSSGEKASTIDCTVKNVEGGKAYADVNAQDSTHFTITVSPDRFSKYGDYTLTYTYTVVDYLGQNPTTGSTTHTIHINSAYSTSDTYNKFLGFIDNPFDGIMGNVWFTAIVTFIAWLLIGYLVMFIVVPIITHLMTRSDDPDRPILRRTLTKQLRIVNIVFAIVNTSYILGASGTTISTVESVAMIIYIITGILIAWRIYRTLLDRLSERMRGRDMFPGGEMQEFESYKPLLLYVGEIILAISAVFSIMGTFGFDMGAIITSAGVVSLGITFGAQQVLNQFFSGLVILSTRPFKKGDLVQLGSGTVVYRVRRVNVMNTELENWDNSDITIVPNNSITAAAVKNITRDTLRCKVHLFMEVSYNTDIALARQALLDVAYANPRVIKDGSVSKPSTRLTEFADSNITLRLTVWVDDYNDHGSISGDLRVAIFKKFNELGINIDYPQVVLHSADPQNAKDVDGSKSVA